MVARHSIVIQTADKSRCDCSYVALEKQADSRVCLLWSASVLRCLSRERRPVDRLTASVSFNTTDMIKEMSNVRNLKSPERGLGINMGEKSKLSLKV